MAILILNLPTENNISYCKEVMAHIDRRLKQSFNDLRTVNAPRDRAASLRNGIGKAQRLFRKACWLTFKAGLRSIFSGQGNELLELDRILDQQTVESWNYLGIHEVFIRRIVGTEDQTSEFDRQFNPRRGLNRERWLDIATATFTGISLPPVELIQLPMGYFAQSGHYLISVLHALGEEVIRAYVTSLNVRENQIRSWEGRVLFDRFSELEGLSNAENFE